MGGLFSLLLLIGILMPVQAAAARGDADSDGKQVGGIYFEGSTVFSRRQLQSMLFFERGGFLNSDRFYRRRSMIRSLEDIRRMYQGRGYLQCSVRDSLVVVDEDVRDLYILIDEGPLFRLDKVEIRGNEALDDGEILDMLQPETGEAFTPFIYRKRVQELLDRYGDMGMPYAEITEQYSDSVRLVWELEISNEVVYTVDTLDMSALNPVQQTLLNREMLLHGGDIYDQELLDESRRRIFELGAYNNVVLELRDRNDENNTLNMELRVSEALRQTWDMNLGVRQGRIEAVNQTYLYSELDWKNRNLFGRAKKLELNLSFNVLLDQVQDLSLWEPSYNLELSYTEPWLFIFRLPSTVRVYHRLDVYSPFNQIVTTANDELYSSGVELSSYYRYRETLRSVFSTSLRSVDSRLSPEKKEIQRKVETQLRFDNRDNFLYPVRGWNITLRAQFTESISSGSTRYTELGMSLSRYIPLWYGAVLAARAESGRIIEQGGSAPLYALYRLGSENTVRGWSQSIGDAYASSDGQTVYAGTAKLLLNTELRQKLYGPLGLIAFADAGNLGSEAADVLSAGKMYISAGIGLTYNTYIGPVRAEFPLVIQDPRGSYSAGQGADISFILALLFAF